MTKTKKRKKDRSTLFAIFDIIVTVFSYFLAYLITNLFNKEYFVFSEEYVIMLLLIIPTWAILLQTFNLALIPRTRSYTSIFVNFMNFSAIGFALMFLYKHIFGLRLFSHYVIISFSIINLISLYAFRIFTYKVFKYFRANGHNISNIIIYADTTSKSFIDSIIEHKEWGFRILMIISDSLAIRQEYGETIRIYPDKINIKNLLDIDIIDEVIYSCAKIDEEKMHSLIEMCEEIGVTFRLRSHITGHSMVKTKLTHFNETPFITFKNTPKNNLALTWKSFTEFWISFLIVFLLSPLMLLISLLIKITSKGPIIFRQERVGLRGRKFYIYKFRTMVANAEDLKEKLMAQNESDGPTFKIKKDPRITFIGSVLRKTGLDELPQLFNVLKGEMSLIGPRPPLPKEVAKYERWHLRRLSVKPGITCTWQIIPNRNEVRFDNWMKLDIQYIDGWSIKKDLELFFRTIKTVFHGTGS
ncbi:MAG: sugar transferase [Bacteroidales bacterium]|nr:sugar transferase [Bacteroidales bacterium]